MTSTRVDRSARLYELWGEIADLSSVAELLGWDQEIQMPAGGQEGRGKLLATIAGLRHARLSSSELADAIAAAGEEARTGCEDEEAAAVLTAQVREAHRIVERTVRIPEALAREKAEAQSSGHAAWKEARTRADFALFRDPLERLVRIAREEASAVATDGSSLYDALLDEYEPGAQESELVPMFSRLREELTAMVRAVADSKKRIDPGPARGHFPVEKQLAFGRRVAEAMGFDFERGRIDPATHPFCTSFDPGDVRITWRWMENDFRSALYGIMHEAGHGLYEQGRPAAWHRTPLGPAVSLGMHESQSRLWENLVGRSRAFWEWALPHFHEFFPDKRGVTADQLWPTLRTVEPSLIRVEADEGTFDLHIIIRFELERALISGDLEVDDLPRAWDDAYEEMLGIRAPDAAKGVLQDLHWSSGAFGYFPTYTLGNLMMAQLFAAARKALGDLDAMVARGEFTPLRDWLRENVHRHGSRYRANDLVQRATGKALAPDAYLQLRADAVEAVYGIRA